MNPTDSPTGQNPWTALAYADWADTLRHAASVDAGRRQAEARAQPPREPLVGHRALRQRARADDRGPCLIAACALQVDFDFCAHELVLQTSDAREQRIKLAPMTTADFHAAVMARPACARHRGVDLDHAGGDRGRDPVRTGPRACELRCARAVNAFWRQLVQARPDLQRLPRALSRQSQPGAFLLGLIRSRGDALHRAPGAAARRQQGAERRAAGDAGSLQPRMLERRLLARQWRLRPRRRSTPYAYPEPAGFGTAPGAPFGGRLQQGRCPIPDRLRTRMRAAAAPDDALLDFMQTTYEGGRQCGRWDRAALERQAG